VIDIETEIFKGEMYNVANLLFLGIIAVLLPICLIIFFDFLNGAETNIILDDISMIIFIFPIVFFILICVYFLGKREGYYDPEAYEIDICDGKIRVRNRDKVWEINGDNIKKLKINGRMLMVWPRDYYPFINSSDGLERHNYYGAMEKSLPLLFRLPVLKRNERVRLNEAIEEFKRINGIK